MSFGVLLSANGLVQHLLSCMIAVGLFGVCLLGKDVFMSNVLSQFFMGDIATPFIVYPTLIQTQTQLEFHRLPPFLRFLAPYLLGPDPTTLYPQPTDTCLLLP
ncbi:hypothetical protein O181_123645 [Austropuccinia psidii MF-1]|uniref:Uncharacterized protein n=1 Tax=Austropuccinia psidii MF-1 TaxID=1389203 RepID=A0A9Q3KRJ9_9BASI|nr:hypothetical protein [Austropuccinia psidii MF-1]